MTIKNLTPHAITVLLDDGSKRVFPSDGIARAAATTTVVGNINVESYELLYELEIPVIVATYSPLDTA